MNLMRIKAKMRRIRDAIEDEEETAGELNLVPYLDISTNVVMFLLLTISFGAPLAQISINAPKLSPGSSADKQALALRLAVGVSAVGFVVNGADTTLFEADNVGKKFPKIGEEYDWEGLTAFLVRVKEKYPDEKNIVVILAPNLTYDILVRTFDAVRSDGENLLFENPALGVEE